MNQIVLEQEPWELSLWQKLCRNQRYKKDRVLFYQEHQLHGVYVLCSGQIALFRYESEFCKIIASPNKGFLIGAPLVSTEAPSPFTALIISDSDILFMPRSYLSDWRQIFMKIEKNIISLTHPQTPH